MDSFDGKLKRARRLMILAFIVLQCTKICLIVTAVVMQRMFDEPSLFGEAFVFIFSAVFAACAWDLAREIWPA